MPKVELQSGLPWGLVLVAFLGLVVFLLVYGIWLRPLPRSYRGGILAVRALLLGAVVLLLFDPRIEWSRKVLVAPRIGIFLDNSLSMANHPNTAASTVYSQVVSVVEWADEHNYQPLIMTFGERLTPKSNLRFEYLPDERLTDFGPMAEVWQAGDLQAGFLFSDGVATAGLDLSAIGDIYGVPIFAVGIGDTTSGLDLSILDVRYPLSLLEQEQGRVQVTVKASNAANKRSRLFVFHEDQLIHSEQIRISSQDYIQTFSAPVVGRLDAPHFRVELMVLPEELTIENNRREFQVDVLPGRRQITILTGALSPNTAFIRQVVSQTQHAVVDHLIFLRGNWQGQESKFWSTPQDLVILDNYPTTSLLGEQMDRLLAKLRRDRTPILVVEGPDNSNREFVRLMRSLGLQVEEDRDGSGRLHRFQTVAQPALDGLREALPDQYGIDFPPSTLIHILNPQTNRAMTAVLVDEQGRHVISFGIAGGSKKGILLLPALASTHLKLNRTGWKNYLLDVLNALVEWQLEPEGFSPYVIQPDRRQYHLGEKVLLRGIMRDRAGIKMLKPILTAEVQGSESTSLVSLAYDFDAGEYVGEFWPGESGPYRVRVTEEEESDAEGSGIAFQVQAGRVELESLIQNRYGLQRLARTTGGRYTELPGVQQLLSGLAYSARTVAREYNFSLWQFPHLVVVLVLLLGLEWAIRRRAGLI
ncbi:MAG: hypothetical protein ACETWG_11415 [Candidatus Neomarinimicrobiota bacterium]